MSRPWGRLYTGTRHHRKIRILRERHPKSWWIWYPLIEMSVEVDDDGLIYAGPDLPYSEEELSKELCLRSKRMLNSTLTTMKTLGLIEFKDGFIRLLSYSERQYPSDLSTPRTRKHKENQRLEKMAELEGERSQNVLGTAKREQIREEQIILKDSRSKKTSGEESALSPRGLIDLYNEIWPNPLMKRPAQATQNRLDKAKVRLAFNATREYWKDVFEKVKVNPFLNGSGKPWNGGRGAYIDWLLDDDHNHVKVWEGKYDGNQEDPPGGPQGRHGGHRDKGAGRSKFDGLGVECDTTPPEPE
jgi:hypothetical protein